MSEVLKVPQPPVELVTQLSHIDEGLLLEEPSLRRADAEFAYKMGGDLVRTVIEVADRIGQLSDNSSILVQRGEFREGAYPAVPEWHFDYTPGRMPTEDDTFEEAVYDNTGLIVCAFDANQHPNDVGTIFVHGGEIELDLLKRDKDTEYKSRQHMESPDKGRFSWMNEAIEEELARREDIKVEALRPNGIYTYASSNIHRPSMMRSHGGTRVIIRVNTPVNSDTETPIDNTYILPGEEPRNVFYVVDASGEWVRRSL